jgi:amidase
MASLPDQNRRVLDLPVGDATALAARLATREVRAVDVVGAQLARLQAVHEPTNCIAWCDPDAALARAVALDAAAAPVGPLHGVPFTVKDWIDVEGLPCTGGWHARADRIAPSDATVVARMLDAGGVLLAKTTVLVESEVYGPVRNPHDTTRSPGASSSGEAAAIGGGGSVLGLGSDSGGSIRLPAAWCGAAGLKPTFGRVPNTGHFPRVGDRGDGRTVIGPLAAHVADLALVLRVIAGADGRDPGAAPVPVVAAGDGDDDLSTITMAVITGEPGWDPAPELVDAVERAATALTDAGARVAPPLPAHLDEAFDITTGYWDRATRTGAEAQRQLEDWDRFRVRMARAAADVDVVVMPVVRERAPLHREMARDDYIFTLPASLTGWPAVVVPLGAVDGLPVAVQLVGKPWQEHRLLGIASAVEATLAS